MCYKKYLKNFLSFMNFIKFYSKKFLEVFKNCEIFKENFNKNLKKINENLHFLLVLILIAGWGLGCSLSFAIFPGFRGGGRFPCFPLVTPLFARLHCLLLIISNQNGALAYPTNICDLLSFVLFLICSLIMNFYGRSTMPTITLEYY